MSGRTLGALPALAHLSLTQPFQANSAVPILQTRKRRLGGEGTCSGRGGNLNQGHVDPEPVLASTRALPRLGPGTGLLGKCVLHINQQPRTASRHGRRSHWLDSEETEVAAASG